MGGVHLRVHMGVPIWHLRVHMGVPIWHLRVMVTRGVILASDQTSLNRPVHCTQNSFRGHWASSEMEGGGAGGGSKATHLFTGHIGLVQTRTTAVTLNRHPMTCRRISVPEPGRHTRPLTAHSVQSELAT